MRILLVDDEQPSLDELEYLLGKYHDVDLAGSFTKPQEALLSILHCVPDVMFLDIEMPVMSGLELAERIRATYGQVAIVFVTAYGKKFAGALSRQSAEYLQKPVSEAKLRTLLEKIRQKMK